MRVNTTIFALIKTMIINNINDVLNDFRAALNVWFDVIRVIFYIVENRSKIDHRNATLNRREKFLLEKKSTSFIVRT